MENKATTEQINELLGVNDSYQTPNRIMEILYNIKEREKLFDKFLELYNHDLSYDWFNVYYQDEHADRKTKKQDFTPDSLADLLAELTGSVSKGSTIYDAASGTGTLLIAKWNQYINNEDYQPLDYLYICEELSDRAIPFLLFNLMIRGINSTVIQCDVLTRECYGAFLVQNIQNKRNAFSSFNVYPYSSQVEELLNVVFVEQKYKPHIENNIKKVKDGYIIY